MSTGNARIGDQVAIVLTTGAKVYGSLLKSNSQGTTVKRNTDGNTVWTPTHSIRTISWKEQDNG